MTSVSIPGYRISEELYNGSRTLVYRGYRETDSLRVVIKLLKNFYPSFTELLSFRNQYTIAKNLNSPLIIQAYSLEPYQNGYALVMEDFGGISLKEWGVRGTRQSLQEFLHIAIALCNTLDILYHQRIIHKDIKPANILINPETKQVKLIDFSLASLLPRETQTLINPNVLEGTLAYISPEQTGRMNRGIDYRTDFYSLGVSFYDLLTGELPFQSNDPMELVHCHIARQPAPLEPFKIPKSISDIVMKLMAKNAEERYQSALGLRYDLENCLTQLQFTGEIKSFPIAQRDVCDRFLIPEKLYGRENEVQQLLAAFERVSQGSSELMLVAGFSGIGKTSVVNEVHKPIVKQRGYFVKGKFDQFNRNIPLSAFVQALRDLIMQLLTESDKQLQQWKTNILEAVGENGQVILEVIPELETIIGQQPPTTELSGTAAQNRFNFLFQKFIQLFTTKSHPLVMFLDDLQWADSASLKLIQLLTRSEANSGYLLLIGAYRDNEVSPAHPLILTLEEINKGGAPLNIINLNPLTQSELNQLVADTLSCAESLAFPLTQLVYRKTQGNPFFATQFLKALHQDRLIQFNREAGCWQCDITQVNQHTLTDDVVEFIAIQLRRLSESTQQVLQLAACIGNQFDLVTLAIVSEQSEIETAACLWKALQEGLILPQSEVYKFYLGRENQAVTQEVSQTVTYKFLHDRVQQAAYSLIPTDGKQPLHLKIGQLLLNNTPEANREEHIFEIVSQLNVATDLITQAAERQALAQFNLVASRKAKAATAYAAALNYAKVGIGLLAQNPWYTQYELILALHQVATEVAYLGGDLEQMEAFGNDVLNHAKTPLDQISVYEVEIEAFTAQARFSEAIAAALAILQQLGVELPAAPSQEDVAAGFQSVSDAIGGRLPAELLDLLEATDVKILAAARILASVAPPAYLSQPLLYLAIILRKVYLSVVYGNEPTASFGYVSYGILMCAVIGNVELGYEFGQLALELLSRHQNSELKGKTLFLVYAYTQHWKMHLRETLHPLQIAYSNCLEMGDFTFAGYSAHTGSSYSFFAGENLMQLESEITVHSKALQHLKQNVNLTYCHLVRQILLNLIGDADNVVTLSGPVYDEQKQIPLHEAVGDRTGLAFLWIYKLVLCCLLGAFAQAVEQAKQARQYLDAIPAFLYVPIFHFYESLAQLALFGELSDTEQQQMEEGIAANQEKLKYWAHHAPMNFLHKFDLVEAEHHRVLGQRVEAIEYYDRAIALAKKNEYIQEEALANELAAKFYLDWAKEKVAQVYMQEAYYCYARWGAKAKTDDLEQRYPQLLQPILQQQKLSFNPLETIGAIASPGARAIATTSSEKSIHTCSDTSISDALDFASVLKAAQVISSSLELNELIASLTRIILENSGAKKAVLLLPQEGTWQVRAITLIDHGVNEETQSQTILEPQSLDTCQDIPATIIYYVKNTQQTVVIDNLQTDIPGVIGEYMYRTQPQSVLCTPIINKGLMVGILYLENKETQGVFTSDRLQVINLLSSQAAISLENAQLYQQAGQALQDLQQAHLQIVQSEKMSALGNLVAGVAHEMNNPLGFIYASLKQAKPTVADLIEHLKLYQSSLPNANVKIKNHAKEIDLDFTLEDLPKIIDSMTMACDRLENISTSLRTFSRADQDYKVPFNIHEGLDSTILILKHRLKANAERPAIEVIIDYGTLPQVECFPGQLNQVFMNILANAIDALDESNTGLSFQEIKTNPNRILIKTSVENQGIKIAIADNGKGMNEEVKQKIFDHLFTTKGVGKGTGLGLAITQQIIVQKHNGSLLVNSTLGEGTEFVITLPILG